MNLSVEREASFEVAGRHFKRNEEEIIFSSDPFFYNAQDANRDGAKAGPYESSPTKVMDLPFTYTLTEDSRNASDSFDPWGGISGVNAIDEQQQQQSFDHDTSETLNRVLFPDVHSLDEDGFPSFTPALKSSIKERYQEQKDSRTDALEVSSSIDDQKTVSKANTKQGVKNIFSANCASFTACGNAKHKVEGNNNNVDKIATRWKSLVEGNNNNVDKIATRWKSLVSKLPQGTKLKANVLQVRRKILSCHQPDIDATVDNDTIVAGDASKDQGGIQHESEGNVNDSFFSYKSIQDLSASLLSTSQDVLSIRSDASTPLRKQKSKAKPGAADEPKSPSKHTSSYDVNSQDGYNDDVSTSSTLKLCIDLYEESAFDALMSNLDGNEQVKEIHIFRSWEGNSERTRTAEDLSLLFKTIRSLSNLEVLTLANFMVDEILFVSLSQWQNQNLHTIRIHLCKGTLTKRLLDVLATLPALKDLTLEMNQSFPFHILLSSQTLLSLTIVANGYNIDNLHAMEMVQGLPRNETLKKLVIEPALKIRTFKLLAAALGKNIGIEFLQFSLLPGHHADTNRAIMELANTLESNASLKSIRNLNHSKIEVNDRTCDAIINALSDNYIIEDFVVFDEEQWFHDKKNKILKENRMETESILPQVFSCGKESNEYNYRGNSPSITGHEPRSIAQSMKHSVSKRLEKIGGNVKSQAQRVADGALDLIGQAVGLHK